MHRQAEILMPRPTPPALPGALSPPLTGRDVTLIKRGREVQRRNRRQRCGCVAARRGEVDLKTEENRRPEERPENRLN